MDQHELEAALRIAEEVADEGAALALARFRGPTAVQKKGAIDLLTEADLAVEALVGARLADAFPGHRVVAEESGAGEDRGAGAPVWYVDPIDGTTNFAHGHPFFAVSIGLFVGDRAALGVISAPALGLRWSGALGLGATRRWRRPDGLVVASRCAVSSTAALADALCATGFPYDRWTRDDDNTREHRAFLKRARGIRRCGAASIDLCLVADGTYDLYWERSLAPWDMCAGAALVAAAGGTLSDVDGGAPDPRSGRLVASNGPLHAEALALLAEVRWS